MIARKKAAEKRRLGRGAGRDNAAVSAGAAGEQKTSPAVPIQPVASQSSPPLVARGSLIIRRWSIKAGREAEASRYSAEQRTTSFVFAWIVA